MSKNIAFDTLFDTVIQKYTNKQNKYNWMSVLKKIIRGSPVSGRSCFIGQHFFNLMYKNITFDAFFDTESQKKRNKQNKYNWISVLKKIARDSPVSGRSCLIGQLLFH